MKLVNYIAEVHGTPNNIITAVPGKKRTGKTTFMTLAGFMAYKRGIPVASNYRLPFASLIKNSRDFRKLRSCLCLLDDFNKWASSKIIKHKKADLFGSIINDSGKNNVSIIYSTKYMMQILKSIRHETDYVIKVQMQRMQDNRTGKKIPVMITCCLFEFAGDMLGEMLHAPQVYKTLPIFRMFDTSEMVRQL